MDPDFKFKPAFLDSQPAAESRKPAASTPNIIKPTLVEKIKNNKLILVGIVVVLLVVIIVVIVSLVTKKPKPKPALPQPPPQQQMQPRPPGQPGQPGQPGGQPGQPPVQGGQPVPQGTRGPAKPGGTVAAAPKAAAAASAATAPPVKNSFDKLLESVDDQELNRHINSENKDTIAQPVRDDSDDEVSGSGGDGDEAAEESEGESLEAKGADNF